MNTYFIVLTDFNTWQGQHKVKTRGGAFAALAKFLTGPLRVTPAGTDLIQIWESEDMYLANRLPLVEVRLPFHTAGDTDHRRQI